jgi:hypothetical protein
MGIFLKINFEDSLCNLCAFLTSKTKKHNTKAVDGHL